MSVVIQRSDRGRGEGEGGEGADICRDACQAGAHHGYTGMLGQLWSGFVSCAATDTALPSILTAVRCRGLWQGEEDERRAKRHQEERILKERQREAEKVAAVKQSIAYVLWTDRRQ